MNLFSDKPSPANYVNKGTDWRLPENRMEAFRRVAITRLLEGECDHWLAGKIIVDYMKLDEEQKAWYALLFGFSYRNHWAMICLQLFPRIWEADVEEIRSWYNDSEEGKEDGAWRRATFAKDTKWNVRKFPDFIKSVQDWLNGESLKDRFDKLCSVGNTDQNFESINSGLKELYGIGRMTSWLTIQTLYEFFDYDIDKWDFQLHDDGCWSQYNALCYLADRLEISGSQKVWDNKGKMTIVKNKRTKETVKEMEEYAQKLMTYINDNSEFHVDAYNVESVLCEYRKTAYGPNIKEFTGWTANELVYQFHELHDKWTTHSRPIDWTPYVLGLMLKGKHFSNFGYDESYFRVVHDAGLNLNTHFYYPDEPDAFEELDIPRPEDCARPKLIENIFLSIPESVRLDYKERFDPIKHLRWK